MSVSQGIFAFRRASTAPSKNATQANVNDSTKHYFRLWQRKFTARCSPQIGTRDEQTSARDSATVPKAGAKFAFLSRCPNPNLFDYHNKDVSKLFLPLEINDRCKQLLEHVNQLDTLVSNEDGQQLKNVFAEFFSTEEQVEIVSVKPKPEVEDDDSKNGELSGTKKHPPLTLANSVHSTSSRGRERDPVSAATGDESDETTDAEMEEKGSSKAFDAESGNESQSERNFDLQKIASVVGHTTVDVTPHADTLKTHVHDKNVATDATVTKNLSNRIHRSLSEYEKDMNKAQNITVSVMLYAEEFGLHKTKRKILKKIFKEIVSFDDQKVRDLNQIIKLVENAKERSYDNKKISSLFLEEINEFIDDCAKVATGI